MRNRNKRLQDDVRKRRAQQGGGGGGVIPVVASPRPWHLDRVLLWLSDAVGFTVRNACEAVLILGQPGSGKTTGPGYALLRSYLAAMMGGLFLTVKVSDLDDLIRMCRATGRERDLKILGPGQPYCFNPLAYIMNGSRGDRAGMTQNIVSLLREIMTLFAPADAGYGGERIWAQAADLLIMNVVDLVQLADEEVSLTNIMKLIRTMPRTRKEIAEFRSAVELQSQGRGLEGFEMTFGLHCWLAAYRNMMTGRHPLNVHTLEQTTEYWTRDWIDLNEKTRQSVIFTAEVSIGALLRDEFGRIFTTTTNISPEETFSRRTIWAIDFNVKEFEAAGRVAQAVILLLWQKAIERRSISPTDSRTPASFCWVDEVQNFLTPSMLSYLSTARTARAASVFLTQNVASVREQLGADATENLLGLLGTKIFCANGCDVTNEYASRTIGEDWSFNMTVSPDGQTSFTDAMKRFVEPVEFTRLAVREAYVYKAGSGWGGPRRNHLKVQF